MQGKIMVARGAAHLRRYGRALWEAPYYPRGAYITAGKAVVYDHLYNQLKDPFKHGSLLLSRAPSLYFARAL